MRDPRRIGKLCERLAAAWRYVPDMRLGQLMIDVFTLIKGRDPFYIEDDEMIELVEKFCKDNTPYKM